MSKEIRVLVVEDEGPVRALLRDYLQARGFQIQEAASGEEALALLAGESFDLVLSDVRMPGIDGMDLLSEIRRRHTGVGVLMLTGCEDASLAVNAMKMGALDYILKPFRLENVEASVRRALEKHDENCQQARYLRDLEKTVEERSLALRDTLRSLKEASEETLEALVAALDAREHQTLAHSKRVSEYTVHLADVMDVSMGAMEAMRRGAMLHDIGKIGISDTILLKPGQLTAEEWVEMRRHPEIGHWILNSVESLKSASEIALTHHERYDGQGYPRSLRGEEVPLGARIFAVADSLDAITSDRPYRQGRGYEEARREIMRNSGTQFDPRVVDSFLRVPPEVWDHIRRSTLEGLERATRERIPVEVVN